ncbi:TetR/AcrR family transcriptional regulator [Paenibacillus wenxiniae]|uniref:TetR/AcrR family transcriptional regulator n=1 Tax=Paenibacillus wenxiniae TaxID=1636843 RepID=A0ABW4RK70_9BACL
MNSNNEPIQPDDNSTKTTRRRGEVLENALLQAAWDELNELGYNEMSMDGVAARAQTNKNALYRRWSSKSELVIAAIIKYVPRPVMQAPDTGNLRDDVLTFLLQITDTIQLVGAETVFGILADHGDRAIVSSLADFKEKVQDDSLNVIMRDILQHAVERGEVKPDAIRERIVSLPFDLIRYEFLIKQQMLTTETVTEIIDYIFLPLVLSVRH